MTSPQEAQQKLQNLAKIGKLKAEPPDQAEFDGLVRSAKRKLPDAQHSGLSPDSRFILAYDAAHSLALAALRWHGYRSENRYIVFQVLDSTVSFLWPNGASLITVTRSATLPSTMATMRKTRI